MALDIAVCFDFVPHPIAFSEGVGHGAAGCAVSAIEALEKRTVNFEITDADWLVPYIEMLAQGIPLPKDDVLLALERIHGRPPTSYESRVWQRWSLQVANHPLRPVATGQKQLFNTRKKSEPVSVGGQQGVSDPAPGQDAHFNELQEDFSVRYVSDVESFYDFIGYVVLCAPDKFPARDYLPVDEQMNIEMAFVELKRGLRIIYSEVADEEKRVRLESLLDQAVHAYSKGDDLCGAHLLQDFQDLIFKRN